MKGLAQFLILATFSYFCSAQCSVKYNEQPPTTLYCSPYSDQQFRLRIACEAMTVGSSDFDSFDLCWYRRRSSDGVEENLGTGNESQESTSGHKKRIILQGISGLNLAPFAEEMPGDYWCQAVVTNSSGQYLLAESNVLTVLRPENYTGLSVCDSVQSEDVTACASVVQLLSVPSASSITMTITSLQSYKSPVTPTESSMLDGSTEAIILVLVGLMVALLALLLLLMAGITITLFLRRKASSKAIPTAAPLQDQARRKGSDKICRHLESHDGFSLQPVEYELPLSLGLSQHPQAMAAENPSDSQIMNSMAYETKREHHQTPQKDLTYSHLQHVQTSCDVSNGGQESQYSKLSHQSQGFSSQSYI